MISSLFFFFNDTATTEIYTLSLHDALPISVGILDDEPLTVIEIIPVEGYFDFTAKYSEGLVKFDAPAGIEKCVYREVMALALRAHRALGCRHFSRVDIKLNSRNIPFVLEVNSIPGLTRKSLLPLSARMRGIEFDSLIAKMVELSLRDEKNKKQKEIGRASCRERV